ncbi:MAG: TonB-dependent receptor, plug [Rhodospirillales bacterium]|jgi:iron complex outermembrane receptor protein|nr:TonB-dependent receptor, plug [Rhodospirillales bacterium]
MKHTISHIACALCAAIAATQAGAYNVRAGELAAVDLLHMSLDELSNIQVTSVSKKAESLSKAAAAVYVITNEDIRRYGATTIPEALRLAPNLQVARVNAHDYAITARGFNSTTANKLLVMIDGRSVYTPLFSGVFWDVQDVMLEDIDRIEVISGPGGTLWGSNAVNGVINIITRKSSDTQGGLLAAGGGNKEQGGAIRYGGKLDDDTTFRVYGKGFQQDNTVRTRGDYSTRDAWHKEQVGFRADSGKTGNKFTVQGDAYSGATDQINGADQLMVGGNLLGRWDGVLNNGSTLQVQSYYDRTMREVPLGYEEVRDTFDVSVQHGFEPAQNHQIVWGGGYRYSMDQTIESATLGFYPLDRNLGLANIFVQDTIALSDTVDLTLGGKLEHNSYTGLELLWNTRLAWELSDQSLLWSSVSRAVRTPSRLDRDLFSPGRPPFTVIAGGPEFESETLTAYEIGYRARPVPEATYSISTYYNDYEELRSLEPIGTASLPVQIGNKMEGSTYGVETWGTYRVLDWWTLKAGANVMKKNLTMEQGSRDAAGTSGSGNDPSYQLSLRSMMSLPHDTEFDIAVRRVDELSSPIVPGYTTLDARIGWQIRPDMQLSLAAFDLLDQEHPEFSAISTRNEIGRSVFLKLQWIFP